MMAMLFMLQECLAARDTYPLLSRDDIETLLAHVLPRREIDLAEVIRQLAMRHSMRQASVDSAYAKQSPG